MAWLARHMKSLIAQCSHKDIAVDNPNCFAWKTNEPLDVCT
jgi:hypothetical protein